MIRRARMELMEDEIMYGYLFDDFIAFQTMLSVISDVD